MYVKRVLPNGVRIISERLDNVRTVSVGIWVGNGSRYEPAELNGISHFIEHMIFKGTEKRSAKISLCVNKFYRHWNVAMP